MSDRRPTAICIATSTDRTARASSTLAPWRSSARRTAAGMLAGWYRVAEQVMPESRPLPDSDACPLRQASRIVTSDSGTDNQLAAASSVTENRREALYRRRPIRPDRAIHTSRAPAALPGASRKPVHRRVWPSRTRPRRRPFLSAMEALDEQERVAV